jgi:hypothetical protein
MTIHWHYLGLALLLLWFPMLTGARISFELSQPVVREVTLQQMMSLVWNWVDLLRAALGTWILGKLAWTITASTPATVDEARNLALLIQAGALAAGVLLQTLRFKRGLVVLGPVFYLSGITVVMTGWVTGPFAAVVGWAVGLASRNARVVPGVTGLVLAVGGYFLGGFGPDLFLNLAILALPLLVATLSLRRLILLANR